MRCEIRDSFVYYEVYGEGRPVILFHGWTLDCQTMINTYEPFFEHHPGWKRIYPDLPGHGRTPGQEWIQNQDQILDVMIEFVDQVIGNERFVVAGMSAGAYLARGVVYRKQKSIDGLLLVVPLIFAADDKRSLTPHKVIIEDPDLSNDLTDVEREIWGMAVVRNQRILDKIRQDPELLDETGDEGFRVAIREDPNRYSFSFNIDRLPEPFSSPTLVICGKQDAFVGYQDAWTLVDKYPRCTYAVLDRAGHLLEWEQESLLHNLMEEWIFRVEEFSGG